MTFEELYKAWTEVYFPTLSGVSSRRSITSAYRYMHILYKMKVRDIRVRHLEGCINDAYFDLGRENSEERRKGKKLIKIFSNEEIQALWNHKDDYKEVQEGVAVMVTKSWKLEEADAAGFLISLP
ncbi:MAG: hypothetical protein NC123_00700 [Butyrivibrio sp.]|nr:hypothetical protein [Butyrivibrio sp.]